MTIRLGALASALIGLMGGVAGRAEAALITYTESSSLSGTLGSTTFTNASVTFTQTANTANVTLFNPASGLYEVVDATSTVTLTGGGFASPVTATLSVPTVTFSNQQFAFGGLAFSAAPQFVILTATSSSFAAYNLQSSLGPISGGTLANTGPTNAIATSQGSLVINGFSATTTFTATTGAVPEPSSMALCGIGSIAGLGYARSRRNRGAIA